MKRRFGVFQGLILSLFSPAFYRDVANHWGGIGFVYLLLLFLLTWIPVLWHWQTTFGNFVNTTLAESLKDMPKIVIKQGKVSSEVEQPYTVTDPKDGRVIFVLDTTGQIDNLDKTPAQFLLTETQLHIRDQQQRQIHDLRDFPDMEFSKESVQEWLSAAGKWLGVAAFPFVMVGSMIRALIVMLLAGVVGMIFRPMLNPDISYGSLMRLAAMGITLPTYISTGLEFANTAIPFPFWFGITLGLTSFYTLFGAKSAAAEPRDMSQFDDDLPPRDPPPYEDRGPISPDAFRAR